MIDRYENIIYHYQSIIYHYITISLYISITLLPPMIKYNRSIKISLFKNITKIGHGNYGNIYKGYKDIKEIDLDGSREIDGNRDSKDIKDNNHTNTITNNHINHTNNINNNNIYCIKKLSSNLVLDTNGFNLLYLREINILKNIKHNNIIEIIDIAVGNSINNIYIILELMDIDLKDIINYYSDNNYSYCDGDCDNDDSDYNGIKDCDSNNTNDNNYNKDYNTNNHNHITT
ncbi:Cell division kinase, partial [Spraguea lophii 42_110]